MLWFSAASVNAPTIPLILDALLWRGGGGGGRARYPGFQVTRMIEGFSGFEIFDSGFFWVGNFGKYFLGWLDLSGDFWGVFKLNYLKIRVSARLSRPRRSANKVRPNLFLKISFFVGFLGG